jgi:hypothetical protein
MKGWLQSYAFLIDPDGPSPDPGADNVDPFVAHCNFSTEKVMGVTTLHYTPKLTKVIPLQLFRSTVLYVAELCGY